MREVGGCVKAGRVGIVRDEDRRREERLWIGCA